MSPVLVIFRKELADAVRDRRTWIVVLISSILAGPIALLILAGFVSSIEETTARREIVMAGAAAAPSLVNFIQRAGGTVREAPDDYRAQIKSGRLQNAVVIVPADFEQRLTTGETVRIDLMFDEAATKAQAAVRLTTGLLRSFNREQGSQRLIARGVSPQLLTPLEVNELNLASGQSRGAQLLFLVPWLALLGAVIGSISVAIDVTAGERERGSLEPLLMNPVSTGALVLGKWLVVALCAASVVVLTLAGFRVAMQFVRSDSLSALMQFGAPELALFMVMLLPFAGLVAALNMLAATYGRTFKEAQTYVSYITLAVNFAPVVPMFLSVRDAAWQLLIPAMAQQTVMMRALRGESLDALDVLLPGAIAVLVTLACLWLQARLLREERIVFSR